MPFTNSDMDHGLFLDDDGNDSVNRHADQDEQEEHWMVPVQFSLESLGGWHIALDAAIWQSRWPGHDEQFAIAPDPTLLGQVGNNVLVTLRRRVGIDFGHYVLLLPEPSATRSL